jgi:hypothetical protein
MLRDFDEVLAGPQGPASPNARRGVKEERGAELDGVIARIAREQRLRKLLPAPSR